MAFDLFITISGLCLLVRKEEELLVLLPATSDDPKHKHHAVLGSHARYQPEEATAASVFVEHHLARQTISFDDFDTDHAFRADLEKLGIAKIPKKDVGTLTPAKSYLQFMLADGGPCPENLCAHEKGGRWLYKNVEQTLATALHWRIRDVNSDVDGREGLAIKVLSTMGERYTVKMRPVNRQIRMYLFHTPADELPSQNPPVPQHLPSGTPAPHFCHYFELFSSGECDAPTLEPDVVSTSKGNVAKRYQHDHIGRRYSCLLATYDDI